MIAISLINAGVLSFKNSVGIIFGSNVGTTVTAQLVAFKLTAYAPVLIIAGFALSLLRSRASIFGKSIFYFGFVFFSLNLISTSLQPLQNEPALVSYLGTSLLFIILLGPFTRLVESLLGEGKMDFQRLDLPTFDSDEDFDQVKQRLERNLGPMLGFLQENYNLVTLSIESNYRRLFDASAKRIEHIGFLQREYLAFFAKAVGNVTDESESHQLLSLITRYDYLFQIHDSITDLFQTRRVMSKHYIELESDVMLMVRELSGQTLSLFGAIRQSIDQVPSSDVATESNELRHVLAKIHRDLLPLLAHPDRRDAGALSNYVTYSRRLGDKLVNFAELGPIESDGAQPEDIVNG